ncbi:MAG TPA: tetratricopeptide repeat protein [Chloroflexia bacterium]|nr:tetratricopeptide repeat protein [Chloroflexia bacterium]
MPKSEQEKAKALRVALEQVMNDLGFKTLNGLFNKAGVNRSVWQGRIDTEIAHPKPTTKDQIDNLISRLRDNGAAVEYKHHKLLYEAIDVSVESPGWPTTEAASVEAQPAAPVTQPGPPPTHQIDTGGGMPNKGTINQSGGIGIYGKHEGPIHFEDNRTVYNQPDQEKPPCPQINEPNSHFGGRDVELAELKLKLKSEKRVALTAVNGLGGIGKTALARQLAYDLTREPDSERCFRAALWLEVTDQPDEERLLLQLGGQVEKSFVRGEKETLEQLRLRVRQTLQAAINYRCAHCGPDRVLLVLDDVWENGVTAVRPLLREALPDNCTVLITTRFETVAINLNSPLQTLDRLKGEAGVAMLRSYLMDYPNLDPALLLQLVETLDGYTLALRLAAQYLREKRGKTSALEKMLRDYQKGLREGTPFDKLKLDRGATREDSLTITLEYSYRELKPEEQTRFRALGAIAPNQPFSLSMLATLWGFKWSNDEEQKKVAEQVDEFANRLRLAGLLEEVQEEEYEEGWHRQHWMLRTYSLGLLKSNQQELNIAITRYEDFIVKITGGFQALQPENWGQLVPYLPHIEALGASLVERVKPEDVEESLLRRAQLFALNTSRYLAMRREVRRDEWMEMGLAVSQRLQDRKRESFFLNEQALLYSHLGEKQKALDLFNQALYIGREDKGDQATTLTHIGTLYSDWGEKQQALEYYNQALCVHIEEGNRKMEATTLNNIGLVYDKKGDSQQALDFYNRALPLYKLIGDREGEATVLNNIGLVYYGMGKNQEALDFFNQALKIHREQGNLNKEAIALTNIGAAYSKLGNNQKALDYIEQALKIHREVGNRDVEASTLNNIGRIYFEQDYIQKALDYYYQALLLQRQLGNRPSEAITLNNIGRVYDELGDKQQALQYFNQALPLLRHVGDKGGEANTLNSIGLVYSAHAEQQKALEYYNLALPLLKQVGDKDGEATTLWWLGLTYCEQNQKKEGLPLFKESQKLYEYIESPRAQVVALYIQQLEIELAGGQVQAASTMPEEQIKVLVGNTFAVKTGAAEHLAEWRAQLQALMAAWQEQGADWEIEVAFAGALLAILDGQEVSLPEGNPYRPYVEQLQAALASQGEAEE